ncbi:MAG: CDP-alcohol phosphatidyltransferase family protein, partial [Pseudomonadales bacterium]
MKPTALPYLPNLLSLSRVPLGVGMALAVYVDDWGLAALLLWIAIGTDVVDGRLARATKTSSQLGGVLDHGSDASFVTLALAALASHGWVPWLLPVLVPLAFLQYLLDSRSLAGQPLRASQLGRYNGIAYFVLAGFPVMQL